MCQNGRRRPPQRMVTSYSLDWASSTDLLIYFFKYNNNKYYVLQNSVSGMTEAKFR